MEGHHILRDAGAAIANQLTDHPVAGSAVSAVSIFLGVAPAWVGDITAWMGLLSVTFGVLVGGTTFILQVRKIRSGKD